jgi:hypothetical protein
MAESSPALVSLRDDSVDDFRNVASISLSIDFNDRISDTAGVMSAMPPTTFTSDAPAFDDIDACDALIGG